MRELSERVGLRFEDEMASVHEIEESWIQMIEEENELQMKYVSENEKQTFYIEQGSLALKVLEFLEVMLRPFLNKNQLLNFMKKLNGWWNVILSVVICGVHFLTLCWSLWTRPRKVRTVATQTPVTYTAVRGCVHPRFVETREDGVFAG